MHLPSHNPWINVKLNHKILNYIYFILFYFLNSKIYLKYKFCAMVASHPNLQWQLLTNMLLKKEFFGKGVRCEPFYHGLTQSGFAYEGSDWIAT